MTRATNAGYEAINEALLDAGAPLGAAESHGMLCGMACLKADPGFDVWVDEVLAEVVDDEHRQELRNHVLAGLFQATLTGLDSDDMIFQPLLPDDRAPLGERARALGGWCQGFLYGLGLGGLSADAGTNRNVREVLADLGEIAKVQFEIEGPAEEVERDYAEVLEYVRAAVLLVSEELRPRPASQDIQ